MKIFSILFFVILFSSCNAQSYSPKVIIKYEAFTRGSSIELSVSIDSIIYKDNQVSKKIKTPSKAWKELTAFIERLDPTRIGAFIPPSKDRAVDKALHATLLIVYNNKEYTSQTFDHGNPPKELKVLVGKIFKTIKY